MCYTVTSIPSPFIYSNIIYHTTSLSLTKYQLLPFIFLHSNHKSQQKQPFFCFFYSFITQHHLTPIYIMSAFTSFLSFQFFIVSLWLFNHMLKDLCFPKGLSPNTLLSVFLAFCSWSVNAWIICSVMRCGFRILKTPLKKKLVTLLHSRVMKTKSLKRLLHCI